MTAPSFCLPDDTRRARLLPKLHLRVMPSPEQVAQHPADGSFEQPQRVREVPLGAAQQSFQIEQPAWIEKAVGVGARLRQAFGL